MAEVTVDEKVDEILRRQRVVVAQVDIAADADTYTVPGMSKVLFAVAVSTTNNAIGCTIAGNVVTFQTAGAEANAKVLVVGL